LLGDATKARVELGWEPSTSFVDLVRMMVDADIELISNSRSTESAN
jgi:GDPmannose 4,6-dehydratase